MAVSIELTKEYGFVVLVVVAYAFLNFWMAFQVGKARRKYVAPNPLSFVSAGSSLPCPLLCLEDLMGFRGPLAAVFRYKVAYPTLYAVESENKDAKLFNCVQVREISF